MSPKSFSRALCRWFRENGRDLPWRRNTDRYRVWVSEIMLQQTRVETVIPYYRRFLRKFPSVRALARAPLSDVLKAWEGLGYYARARNLHKAARLIREEHKGLLPEDSDDWLTLPGVGKYTSAAIASITIGEPVPVIDGNVERVVSRLMNDPKPPVEIIEYFLRETIDETTPGDFNQGIMELGQAICTPRNARCPDCPLKRWCDARRDGTVDQVPERAKPRAIPHHEIAVGVCRKGKKVLVSRRKESGFLGGLWEFPGGKIRKGETARRALAREFREEVGIEIGVGRLLTVVPFRYSHFSVRLHTYLCRHVRGRARAISSDEVRWALRGDLKKLAFPRANRTILEALDGLG